MAELYRIVELTGSLLMDANGRSMGPEVGLVISRHRALYAAADALRIAKRHRPYASLSVIRSDGEPLSCEEEQTIRMRQQWGPWSH